MRKIVLTTVMCIGMILSLATAGMAQTKVIHFWNFNSYTSGYTLHLPAFANIGASYSAIDTNKARWIFQPQPGGVSSSYLGYSDVSAASTSDYDTVNQSPLGMPLGTTVGNYFRARNPNDSMWLLVYIPSTNYQNITIRYGTESSSTTSGDSAQIYAYSLDSGVTWNTAGLSVPSLVLGSSYLTFNAGQVTITDPAANNNPKLVFRITFKGRNTGTSGNNRFDNFCVKGDTILPSGNLEYFWHFNTFTGSYANPNFPYIAPDYFIHDSSKAKVHMGLFPGTSLSNPVYFDNVTFAAGDYDTVNNVWPSYPTLLTVPGGNGIRPRNPSDSTYLYYYIPTNNYKNNYLTWGTESSSYTSGDSLQVFSYSIDSGLTWQSSGLSEPYDSAKLTLTRVRVAFTDPLTNNNPKLVFRINFKGRNLTTSGNNRFDNISLQGDSIISPLPTIVTTPNSWGPLCNTTNSTIYVPFTTTGAVNGPYHVQITYASGNFPNNFTSNIIDSFPGTMTSPITAIIPAGTAPGTSYRIRVVSSYPGIYGTDNGSNIALAGVAAPISGPTTVCGGGATISLIESGGGTWTSSNTAVGTIGSSTGVVTGLTPGVTTITYSAGVGCTTSTTVTVNPVPAGITGLTNECVGVATTLADVTTGGTWTSGTTSVATIGSGSGAVNPIAVGTSTITYTLPVTGCRTTQVITVNSSPAAIAGSAPVCIGSSVTLTDATSGGTWASSDATTVTIGSATGVATGVAAGVATITYTSTTGCVATAPFTVNPNPSAITGPNTGCIGGTTTLNDATAFGAWTSSNTAVATIGSSTGVVSGLTVGTTNISYTLSTGCQISTTVTINPVPGVVSGANSICAGATTLYSSTTTGGTWSSSNTAVATVSSGVSNITTVTGIAGGTAVITYTLPTGCAVTKTITINALPAAIAGQFSLYCLPSSTTLTDVTPSGSWTSSTPAVATIGSASGLVTGVTPGTTTITYTLPTGCFVTAVETVYPTPAPISGSANACVGATTNYNDATAFGAWSSSNTSVITVGSGTGIATGVAVGTANIIYSVSTGCTITKSVTVNPVPSAITGTLQVCAAGTTLSSTTLSDASPLGSWSSSVPALANVAALTGVVSGIAAGNPVITYTLPTGCYATANFTVNPLPAPIGGVTSVYCIGSTALLNDFIPGGSWSSSNSSVASIDGTGLVTGVAAGSATISYTLPTGCYVTYVENITSTPAAITGTPTTCISTNTTFSDVTAFGAWSSSDATIASVGSGTGIVTGVNSGTAIITYELSPSCLITKNVTVNPQPLAISGTPQVCIGSTTTLTDAGGGTWTSSIPALASVDPSTGVVSGIVAGTVAISYTLPTGCVTSTGVTVNPLPVISGQTSICLGLASPLFGNIPGGTWSSSNTSIATIGSSTGLVSGVVLGSATITYTLPTGCFSTTTVSVNPPPAAITGTEQVCIGLTTTLSGVGGGGWYSSNPAVASVGFGTGIVSGNSVGTATITYSLGTSCISLATVTVNALPDAIAGTTTICQNAITTLTETTPGGSWSSSNTAQALIGTSTGVMSGVSGGNPTITYTVISTGCMVTTPVTVNAIADITGPDSVCTGLTMLEMNALAGGTWTSGTPAVATISAPTGIVTGVTAGTATVTYTLTNGCISTRMITVNANPAPISGNDNVCLGATYTFTNPTSGGLWSSSNPSVAIAGPGTGSVTGSTLGTATIYYTLSNGCNAASYVTVDPLPAAITGTMQVCVGLTTTLADATTGGTWTSSSTPLATVTSGTGVVTGVTAGSPMITYTLPTGCYATTGFTVKPLPTVYNITGGGSYCAGGAGLHIGLSGSDSGISYQLYLDTAMVGAAIPGTNAALDFGLKTAAGIYKVEATNTVTGCTRMMNGTETIVAIALPAAYNVTGGGGYCVGDSGVHVGLSHSDSAIRYQLYRGTTAVGTFLAGDNAALDFGLLTPPGTYKVIATNPLTTCTRNMNDSAVIFVDTLFTPTLSITVKPTGQLQAGQSDTLTVHVTGGGGSLTYQWVNGSTYIAGATSTSYISSTFHNNDSLTCLVTATSTCGTTITPKSITLHVHDVAVEPVNFAGANLKLIPNPNNGLFTISGNLGTQTDELVYLEVTNMLGQIVYRQSVMTVNGELNQQIRLENSSANGMYLLNIRSGSDNKVFHFVMEK